MSVLNGFIEMKITEANEDISLKDYFAAQAMVAIMQETQEMRIASFWDWCKSLLVAFLHFNFLSVNYVKINNDVYLNAAKRAYEYAEAMMKIRSL
jgi:hypothetical protein